MSSFESFIPSINALASVIYPRDPVVGTLVWPGVADVAAGDLTRTLVGGLSDPFGMEVIRLYRLASSGAFGLAASGALGVVGFFRTSIGIISEDVGIDFFTELDAQADAVSPGDTYATLYAANPAAAAAIVTGIIAQSLTPITPAVPSPAALFTLYAVAWRAIAIAFWENFGENRVRANLVGFGPEADAPPIYSDPANGVANPNTRTVGQGGAATTMTAWDYWAYPWPVRQALNVLHETSLLEWQAGAPSEAALATLQAAYANTTAISLG